MVSIRKRMARNYHFAKISDYEAALIRDLAEAGMPKQLIAAKFDLARRTVRDIISFRTWRR